MRAPIILLFALLCLFTEVRSQDLTYQGHWEKTWNVESTKFHTANYGFAFSGEIDVDAAIHQSSLVSSNLHGGKKFITLGGGNSQGRWTSSAIHKINEAIMTNRFIGYDGIAYDIEEGDAGLSGDFLHSFWLAKSFGYSVVVTVSKTAPYGISDARDLMWQVIHSTNVDVISPIMYASGVNFLQCVPGSGHVDYGTLQDVPWEWYRNSQAAIVPSLWHVSSYTDVHTFLTGQGISPRGYIAWCPI